MQSGTVRQIIDIENLILAEHEHLRQELDLRLQKLQEEAEQSYKRRQQQLEQERREFLEQVRTNIEGKAADQLKEAAELARRLDSLDDDTLQRSITEHLNLLLPGADNDRQDVQS